MKIITLNTEHGRHLPALFDLVEREQPAVLCLQEVFAVDIDLILQKTGYHGFFAPIVDFQETLGYPVDARGEWGELLLYQSDLVELVGGKENCYTEHYYVGSRLPVPLWTGPETHNRVVQVIQVESAGTLFAVGNTHFTWSADGQSTQLQQQHFQALSQYLDQYPDLILCGDFNAPRGRETFALFTTRFTDNVPSEVTTTVDSARHYSGKQLNYVVDDIFSTPSYQVTDVRVICGVSDHCAVVGEVAEV